MKDAIQQFLKKYKIPSTVSGIGIYLLALVWSKPLQSLHIMEWLNGIYPISQLTIPQISLSILIILCCSLAWCYSLLRLLKKQIKNHLTEIQKINSTSNKFFDIGRYKWKATIKNNNILKIDDMPYCKIHDRRFIKFDHTTCCPICLEKEDTHIIGPLDTIQSIARSSIEKLVNENKKITEQSHSR